MAVKIRNNMEFRHPELAALLQGLTDEQAAKLGPLSVERDGVAAKQRREGGRVHCREFEVAAASGGPSLEMDALHAAVAAGFRIWTASRRRSATACWAVRRSATRPCSRRSTPKSSARVPPALRSADGPARPGREDVRDALRVGPGRSGSNGAVSAAASAAAAVSLWTGRWVWRTRPSRRGRKASTRTPLVPPVMRRRAASSGISPAWRFRRRLSSAMS